MTVFKNLPKNLLFYSAIILAVLAGTQVLIELDKLGTRIHKQDETMKVQEKKIEEQGALLNERQKEVHHLQTANEQLQKNNQELLDKHSEQKRLLEQKEKELQKAKEEASRPLPSRGEETTYKEFYVTATAYTAYCGGCSGKTKWNELDLRKNPQMKVIAVDPKVIPLGSKVHVEGYGYAVAADTGGAIKNYKIDVFVPTKQKANEWGVKKVKIRILN